MKLTVKSLVPLVMFLALPAQSQDRFTAKDLEFACHPPSNLSGNDRVAADEICHAYVRGLTDGFFLMQEYANYSMTPCLPKDASVSIIEAQALFDLYLKAHPSAADNSAGLVMGQAIVQAYPCRKPN